ncbi:iron-regulated protein [Candidatus Entotheonella serta]|nr:iron-regulated protein [Candidatus Entotheonella serta]
MAPWRLQLGVIAIIVFGSHAWAVAAQAMTAQSATLQTVLNQYATIVHASYQDAYASALALRTALEALGQAPSTDTLEAAKAAWKRARIPYGQTEAYRFYDGPIDGDGGPEGMLNAWPLDESYIDYVEGDPTAGMINNPEVAITAEQLRALNEEGGEENVSTGFHAIEFLLWGQDQSTDGPGTRPYTDYTTSPSATRRGQYLLTVAEMLTDDLRRLVTAWAPDDPNNYRAAFTSANPTESLRKMLSGIGVLSRGELAGERMAVALSTRDQEDEHSCFSDNTHVDIIQNAQGIRNVYDGRYVRTDGTVVEGASVGALIRADLHAEMTKQLDETATKVHAISPPFDRAIVTEAGRQIVQEGIDSLRAQATLIVTIAKELGIANLQVEIPE